MRITKEKAEENRAALIKAAGRLFRERGIDGVGVAEISKAAGLTHGALYAHFPSKEALAAEALGQAAKRADAGLNKFSGPNAPDLGQLLDHYLTREQRDDPGAGCSLAALASEIGRQDATVSARFTEGYLRFVRVFEEHVARNRPDANARQTALAAMAALIGGVAVARAVLKSDPALSDEVLVAMRAVVGELGGNI